MIRVTQEHRVIQEEPKELRVFKELKELLEMAHRVLLVLREPTEITATMVPTALRELAEPKELVALKVLLVPRALPV